MDFDFYRNFIVTAEMGNISQAAKRLNLVQPALSAQIKTLEKYYGVQLFRTGRGRRQIELTEAGQSFLQQARRLCSAEESMNLSLQSFKQQTLGTLRISIAPVRSNAFIKDLLLPFAKQHPQLQYQFHEATVERQLRQLRRGEIDLAFANAPLPDRKDLQIIKVRTERFYLFYQQNMELLWQNNTPTANELASLPLASNYGSYPLLRSFFREYDLQPNFVFLATTAANALTFASSGMAVAIAAALEEDPIPANMQRLPLLQEGLSFDQVLYYSSRTALSPAAQLFLEYFKEQIW